MSERLNIKKCEHYEIDNNDVIFIEKYNERYSWLTSFKCYDYKGVFFHCKSVPFQEHHVIR